MNATPEPLPAPAVAVSADAPLPGQTDNLPASLSLPAGHVLVRDLQQSGRAETVPRIRLTSAVPSLASLKARCAHVVVSILPRPVLRQVLPTLPYPLRDDLLAMSLPLVLLTPEGLVCAVSGAVLAPLPPPGQSLNVLRAWVGLDGSLRAVTTAGDGYWCCWCFCERTSQWRTYGLPGRAMSSGVVADPTTLVGRCADVPGTLFALQLAADDGDIGTAEASDNAADDGDIGGNAEATAPSDADVVGHRAGVGNPFSAPSCALALDVSGYEVFDIVPLSRQRIGVFCVTRPFQLAPSDMLFVCCTRTGATLCTVDVALSDHHRLQAQDPPGRITRAFQFASHVPEQPDVLAVCTRHSVNLATFSLYSLTTGETLETYDAPPGAVVLASYVQDVMFVGVRVRGSIAAHRRTCVGLWARRRVDPDARWHRVLTYAAPRYMLPQPVPEPLTPDLILLPTMSDGAYIIDRASLCVLLHHRDLSGAVTAAPCIYQHPRERWCALR